MAVQSTTLDRKIVDRPPASLWRDAFERLLKNRLAILGGITPMIYAVNLRIVPEPGPLRAADDVSEVCEAVLKLPAHINVNTLEIMPVQQAFGTFAVDRA